MYATATVTAPPSRSTLALRSAAPDAAAAALAHTAVVASTDLLQGRKAVEISHNGSTYRLQATRLGKLILTK